MNNKNHDPSPDERARMVEDALKYFKIANANEVTPEKLIVERCKSIARDVHKTFTGMQVVNPKLIYDKNARYREMSQLYIDRLRQFNKDELLFIAAMLHTEAHIEHV